jgi:hypothetical protein
MRISVATLLSFVTGVRNERRVMWATHVTRIEEMINEYMTLVGRPELDWPPEGTAMKTT